MYRSIKDVRDEIHHCYLRPGFNFEEKCGGKFPEVIIVTGSGGRNFVRTYYTDAQDAVIRNCEELMLTEKKMFW